MKELTESSMNDYQVTCIALSDFFKKSNSIIYRLNQLTKKFNC